MSIQGINIPGSVDTTIINTSNSITITGSGVGNSFIAFSGTLSGFSTLVFNHNLSSDNIQPKLYVRHSGSYFNNWEPATTDYNNTRFETGYAQYGIYDFRTGTNPFNGWSGINMGNCSFFGFSGGILQCVASAASVDFPIGTNNFTVPCLVKRVVGDFDIWTDLTGVYNTNFHGNGLIAMSIGMTGANGVAAVSVHNVFASTPRTEYKIRDIAGDGKNETLRDSVRFFRLTRKNGIVHSYFKSGVNDAWLPMIPTVTGRAAYLDVLSDEVYVGGFVQTNNALSAGLAYNWNFIKSWSPVELRASGTNSILITNNSSVGQEIKVVIPTSGFDLTTGNQGPKGSYYFVLPGTIDTASNNSIPDMYCGENNIAYEWAATLKVPCSGQPILGNIKRNGTNIVAFTVPTGVTQVTSGVNFTITSGDVLAASLSQVGTTSAGTTLTLSINVK